MSMHNCFEHFSWYWITSEKKWKYTDWRLQAQKSWFSPTAFTYLHCVSWWSYCLGSFDHYSVDMKINVLPQSQNFIFSGTSRKWRTIILAQVSINSYHENDKIYSISHNIPAWHTLQIHCTSNGHFDFYPLAFTRNT